MERAKRLGGCEFCVNPSPSQRLTWHHVFGRGHIIPEPWASYYPLTLMICFEHHRAAHDQDHIRRAMEWMVIDEFFSSLGFDMSFIFDDPTPINIITRIVNELHKNRITPPGYDDRPLNKKEN